MRVTPDDAENYAEFFLLKYLRVTFFFMFLRQHFDISFFRAYLLLPCDTLIDKKPSQTLLSQCWELGKSIKYFFLKLVPTFKATIANNNYNIQINYNISLPWLVQLAIGVWKIDTSH